MAVRCETTAGPGCPRSPKAIATKKERPDIIAHLGVSKSKFYRDVKEITEDYSPADVINLVRLGKSIEMMSSGKYSISEAAFACGFSSASYFSRTFHKYYNMSPSDYVKQHLA